MIRALKWVFKWAALATLFLFLVLMWSVACLLSRLAVRPEGRA